MKAYICDHCGERKEPEPNYDVAPIGWFSVSQRQSNKYISQHFCSAVCVSAAMLDDKTVLAAAEAVARG